MFHSFVDRFNKELEEECERISDDMINGSCKSYDAYRYSVGVIQGLAVAKRVFSDLQQKLEEDEDVRRKETYYGS
jgi:hypothetical protein